MLNPFDSIVTPEREKEVRDVICKVVGMSAKEFHDWVNQPWSKSIILDFYKLPRGDDHLGWEIFVREFRDAKQEKLEKAWLEEYYDMESRTADPVRAIREKRCVDVLGKESKILFIAIVKEVMDWKTQKTNYEWMVIDSAKTPRLYEFCRKNCPLRLS